MKYYNKLLIIVFIFNGISFGQVILDSLAINTEFYGVINKTSVELYFYNPTEKDSLEAIFSFNTNKCSFVENLYLDIDNKLTKARSFQKTIGWNLYRKIVGKKLDPAYLTTTFPGYFILRIFPVNKHQFRKVVIVYYTILERNNNSNINNSFTDLNWYFRPHKTANKKIINIFSLQPKNVSINYSQINNGLKPIIRLHKNLIEHRINNTTVDNYLITFNFDKCSSYTKYYNKSVYYFSNNIPVNEYNYPLEGYSSLTNTSPSNFIKYLIINSSRLKDTIYYDNYYSEHNSFLTDMLNYLSKKKLINIKLLDNKTYNKTNYLWKINDSIMFTGDIKFHFTKPKRYISIFCPFANKIKEYCKIINSNTSSQLKSGFLTYELSKVVLENEKSYKKIIDSLIYRYDYIYYNKYLDEPVSFYIGIDKLPNIKSFEKVNAQLIYPNIDEEIKPHKLYIRVMVNNLGEPIFTEPVKWENDIIAQGCQFVLSLASYEPGFHNGFNITCPLIIPLVIRADSINIYKNKNWSKSYIINKKNFWTKLLNNSLFISEENFDINKAYIIKFKTEEFFELLYKNPDVIEIVYKTLYVGNIKNLGLVLEKNDIKNHILICKE